MNDGEEKEREKEGRKRKREIIDVFLLFFFTQKAPRQGLDLCCAFSVCHWCSLLLLSSSPLPSVILPLSLLILHTLSHVYTLTLDSFLVQLAAFSLSRHPSHAPFHFYF